MKTRTVTMRVSSSQPPSTFNKPNSEPLRPYEEIAEGMEASFTSHMLGEMRKSIPKETPDSSSMEYYNSLLDYERSQLMAKSDSGLGIKKIILDQITPADLKNISNRYSGKVSSEGENK